MTDWVNKKIICSCGSASFLKVVAIIDAKDHILEKTHAYQCVSCKEIWEDADIEQIILSHRSSKDNNVRLSREYDL